MSNPVVPDNFGSTYLNGRIESYADLVYRTKAILGAPVQGIELTDAQWAHIVDKAIEVWTQFEGNRQEEYLVFCSDSYKSDCGVKLDELLQVGCNKQYCYETVVTETVTSTDIICDSLGTSTAFLSVTPFTYPTAYNYLDPYSTQFSGVSGQYLMLNFDPDNPWDLEHVCKADCVTIKPVNSEWFKLSANYCLSAMILDFDNDPVLSPLLSSVSAYIIDYPTNAVPLSSLDYGLSFIPVTYFDVGCFYPQNINFGPPVAACVNIGNGSGFIYPNCNTSLINSCSALSSQYTISPKWDYVTTSITISSVTVSTSSTDYATISSYFINFCSDCRCNCNLLSTYNDTISAYTFITYRDVLSGSDGNVYDLSATDISGATHIKLYNVPSCAANGSIPLNSNDGILGTFTLCNTALNTNGPMKLPKVQFFHDFKLPEEAIGPRCNWENNGFTMTNYNSAYGECVRATPELIKVDVDFCKKITVTNVGTVSSFLSGNIDSALHRSRKILGVFTVDDNSSGYGGFGGDLLFNFDYALLANTFGYDLQGTRTTVASKGYDLLTYHMARAFVEHSKKMLRYVSYNFNPKTQYLKITPPPRFTQTTDGSCCTSSRMGGLNTGYQCYMVGVYIEPPIEDVINEYWVQEYVLALAMFSLGQIRGKFGNVRLYDGTTLAGDHLLQYAITRMENLMKELRDDHYYGPGAGGMFYVH